MKCFVTGASGFLGANLVHELIAQGFVVRCLLRPGADTRGLSGIRFEAVSGDVTDKSDALGQLMEGCEWVFHLAANYRWWLPEYGPMYKTNVLGTQKVLRGAVKARVKRIVYTSTTGCIALPKPSAENLWVPSTEEDRVSAAQMSNHYKKSKWQAEVAAREAAAEGVPVVIVNPSTPIGARDIKPTPTGRFIVDFLNNTLPGYLDTEQNWVPVQDVVHGHILAAKKGRIGERYILGHAEGNGSMRHMLEILSQLTGYPAPKAPMRYPIAIGLARISELGSTLTKRPPRISVAEVRMARRKMWVDPSKAIQELGIPQTSLKKALSEAVAWFQQNGYVKNPSESAGKPSEHPAHSVHSDQA